MDRHEIKRSGIGSIYDVHIEWHHSLYEYQVLERIIKRSSKDNVASIIDRIWDSSTHPPPIAYRLRSHRHLLSRVSDYF